MTTAQAEIGARPVGVFPVSVDAQAVVAFAAALGRTDPSDTKAPVPLTFPLRWFSDPAIRAALVAASLPDAAGTPAMLPVHIEQRIALTEPLRIGAAYRLTTSVIGPDARNILRVTATLSDDRGNPVGSLASGFLLVSTDAGQPPATRHR